MKIITTTAVGVLLAVAPFAVPAVFAQTTTTTSSASTTPTATVTAVVQSTSGIQATLRAQIAQLLKQVKALQVQIARIQVAQKTIVNSFTTLRSQMRVGSRGNDVKVLQKLLASDPSIYPRGLVTGYYGRLTEDAVKKFQANHGISPVGEVGPETRMLVNSFLKRATSTISMNFLRRAEGERESSSRGGDRSVSVCHRSRSSGMMVSERVSRRTLFSRVKQGDSVGECESEQNNNRSERESLRSRRGGDHGGESENRGRRYGNMNINTSASSFGQESEGENNSSSMRVGNNVTAGNINGINNLNTIVLSSLVLARQRAHDAAVQSNLATIRTEVELDYVGNNNSYGSMSSVAKVPSIILNWTGEPGATGIASFVSSMVSTKGDKVIARALGNAYDNSNGSDVSYYANADKYFVAAKLYFAGGPYWCVDSSGFAGKVAQVPNTGGSCVSSGGGDN